MKNLYIIYGCNKYWSRLIASKSTWMNNMSPNEDYIVLGETCIPEFKMVGFPSDNGQYLNLGVRTLMFLDEYSEFLKKWDWITFVDDDAYLFRSRLRKMLEDVDKKNMGLVVGKHVGKRKFVMNSVPARLTLMHGGATISFNRLAVKRTLDYIKDNKEWLYDNSKTAKGFRHFGDVCVSFLCQKIRATIINRPFEMSYRHHKFSRLKHSEYHKIISSHNLNDEDKRQLYEFDFSAKNASKGLWI